jgi:hypothetical protein
MKYEHCILKELNVAVKDKKVVQNYRIFQFIFSSFSLTEHVDKWQLHLSKNRIEVRMLNTYQK